MITGRNQVISRSFWRRTGQDRSGDFQEIMPGHSLTQLCNNLASKNDLFFHSRITQIQITVFQTGCFIRFLTSVNFKWKFIINTLAKYLDIFRYDFDFTGRKVAVLAGTLPDCSGDR